MCELDAHAHGKRLTVNTVRRKGMNAHLKKLLLLALLVGIAVTALPARSMAIGEEGTFSVAPEFGFYGADRKAINSFFTMGASGHYFVMDGLACPSARRPLAYFVLSKSRTTRGPRGL